MKSNEEYKQAKELGLTDIDRWSEGVDHHPESVRLFNFLEQHDLIDYNDFFCWKKGGDGDNGEVLLYQLDAFFELQDKLKNQK